MVIGEWVQHQTPNIHTSEALSHTHIHTHLSTEENGCSESTTTESCSPPRRRDASCRCRQNTNLHERMHAE